MEKMNKMFAPLGKCEEKILADFDEIVQGVKPLSSKQLYQMPLLIKELSHQLTDERTSRRTGYMNETTQLSSYVRYFMWWNLYRLSHLFAGLPEDVFSNIADGDYCIDLGSGPLTVVCSLFLARPELRSKKITWYCVDISQNALSLGEEIFLAMCARLASELKDEKVAEPWKIIRVKGDLSARINNRAKFLTCANMFNELYYDTRLPLEEAAKKYTQNILNYVTEQNSSIMIVEPAFPRSSRFVSLTRDALLRKNFRILSPCLHESTCPMDGRRGGKWCHFVLDTKDAPKKLLKLSEASGLSKDRASLSFVFAQKADISVKSEKSDDIQNQNELDVRIASDEIFLPGRRIGRYGCSKIGLVLVTNLKDAVSGDFIKVNIGRKTFDNLPLDKKSGAKLIEQKDEISKNR